MNKRIAVIGISYRLPGTSYSSYWDDLISGKDLVTEVEESRWSKAAYLHPDRKHPGSSCTFAAGSVGDISGFDPAFFGISPREAAMMDPQQRVLLELAWEAIEHAGTVPSALRGSDCGVFVGISSTDNAYRAADDMASVGSTSGTGNTLSIAANRISYVFDFHGPSMAVDTACSSSLVAFNQACRAIQNGDSSLALAGGISLHLHPYGFVSFTKATMLSPKGRCQVFDEAGDGYVRSEGGGLFLLKDYDQAVADGDRILAVVAGTAVNTDGSKSGLTVPNPEAQAQLLRQVYSQAGVAPDEIDYIEAHGTGTAVGDPIETEAIGRALGQLRKAPLPIGSVKSNMGHLEPASGVAGLVKAIYSIQHRCVPATISMKQPNPNILFDDWNIEVVSEARPLPADGPLTLGVNSFGFGGANAHVVLQSPPAAPGRAPESQPSAAPLPIILSGATDGARREMAAALAETLASADSHSAEKHTLYDIAYNANFRRERHRFGALLFASSTAEAAAELNRYAAADDTETGGRVHTGHSLSHAKGPVFVYSGNGCQWETMGRDLLQSSALFRQAVAEVDGYFEPLAGFSLQAELRGDNGSNRFDQTEIAQPALFAIQVGLTTLLRHQGVQPVAVTGHSVGEVAAAWASGALTLAQAVELIYVRSHHQGLTRGTGKMTAVGLGQQALTELLQRPEFEGLSLAGANSHRGTTVAGDATLLDRLEAELEASQTFYRRLELDYAFHSDAMDPIQPGVVADLAALSPQPTQLPFISTVTGAELAGTELGADYWWLNIRRPVLFEAAVDALVTGGHNVFVEIGAHPILRSYLQDGLRAAEVDGTVIATLSRQGDELQQAEEMTAKLLLSGCSPLDHWFPVSAPLVELPRYPWQRQPLQHPITSESQGLLNRDYCHPLLGYRLRQQGLSWENQLDTQRYPWLAEHSVGDSVVFPGAGYVELVLAAAKDHAATALIEIEALEIIAPLLLDERPSKVVRVALDETSGGIQIKARPQASDEPWGLHVRARLMAEPTSLALAETLRPLPQRSLDFDRQQHQALTEAIGLQYGPTFSAITHGWVDGNRAVGVFDPVAGSDDDAYLLHPGLLDSAFQLAFPLLREVVKTDDGMAYIPTRLERIHLQVDGGVPRYAEATILRRSPHSICAEFRLYDQAGQCVARVQEARFKAIRLRRQSAHQLDYLEYHLTPVPSDDSRDRVIPEPVAVERAVSQLAQRCQQSDDMRRYSEELAPLLEAHQDAALHEALATLTSEQGLISQESIDQLLLRSGESHQLLAHCLERATQQGLLTPAGDNWRLAAADETVSASMIWSTLVREYPQFFALILPAGRAANQLKALCLGDASGDDFSVDPRFYAQLCRQVLNEEGAQLVSQSISELVAEQLDTLPAGQRLRLIETGPCQPWLTERLATLLDHRLCDLVFGSADAAAIAAAEQLQQRFPLLETLDLNNAVRPEQRGHLGVMLLSCSGVEAAREALSRALSQLLPGASLLLVGCHHSDWMDAVLGLSAAWWPGSDSNRSHQLAQADWRQLLQEQGLAVEVDLELSAAAGQGCYLMTVRAPLHSAAIESPSASPDRHASHWLLVGDGDGPSQSLSETLVAALTDQGQQVTVSRSLPETLSQIGERRFDQILYLAGLGANLDPVSAQTRRCFELQQLVVASEPVNAGAGWWLLTHGVGAGFERDGQRPANLKPAAATPADAALWGFGRTLMNELEAEVRLLDIPALELNSEVTAALTAELLQPSREQELVLDSAGERLAPRLRCQAPPSASLETPAATQTRLGFPFPGQLKNLRWEQHPSQTLQADEIEVQVRATGLNFRDVMYALGLLSDEAIENGFAGPTLGLEFAGQVTRVGAEITDFAVGDAVVGFGPASFSDHVITRTQAVNRIPANIGFEAAATIPSTFFTVYYALHHLARVQPGERVLIHGAAGGAGISAIQVAQWLGAEIYATAGSAEKRDFLRLMGVQHIYDSRSLTFAEEILRDSPDGRGVDVVLNSLAGEAINRNLRVLKPMGRFLELGKRDFYENTHIGLRPFRNNISYFGIDADQVMQECPELTARLFKEMMALFEEGALYPLPFTRFDANHVEEAFRFMQQARQIGKIVVSYNQGITGAVPIGLESQPALQLDADGCYLVTGGLGGFGLRTAHWLAEKGARQLILLGRRGPTTEEAQAGIARLRAAGVEVQALACDITDFDQLQGVVSRCGADWPPLKGVIHAAAVIEDALIRNLDAELIRRVFAPKIGGAEHLDRLTRDIELDFFVLFSSATTLLGNPGQASYVAANHWLEALAASRRQAGLPALCARWGAIDDAGFLARNEKIKDALQGRMGGSALSAAAALAALEKMLLAGSGTLGVMELEWSALNRFLPSASQPKFRELALAAEDDGGSAEDGVDIQQLMDELSDEELQQTVVAMLGHELSRILLLPEEQLDGDQSVYDMGLDSLMGVELMVAIEGRFGINVPVMVLSEAPTLNKLAAYLIAQFRKGDDGKAETDNDTDAATVARIASQHGIDEQQQQKLQADVRGPQSDQAVRMID